MKLLQCAALSIFLFPMSSVTVRAQMEPQSKNSGRSHSMPSRETGTSTQGMHEQMKQHREKAAPGSELKPAQGASVKIIAPEAGQAFSSDEVPIRFQLIKGKSGDHVHAYVDGELTGMFKSETGTLTGVRPGRHVLELRVVMGDHKTELNATDTVEFTVKEVKKK